MHNRKYLILLVLICIFLIISSCNSKGSKEIGKKVTNSEITITPQGINTNVTIKYYNSPTTTDCTWPDIYNDSIVYCNRSRNGDNSTINILNSKTFQEQIIYKSRTEIDDTKIGSEWVYWVEGSTPETWEIKAYNIKDKSVLVIGKSTHKNPTLIPRLSHENNIAIWIEGFKDDDGSVKHILYSYNPQENKIVELSKLNYMGNPYTILNIENNIVSFADKGNDGWFIKTINILSRETKQYPCIEEPLFPCCDGDILTWIEDEEKRELYLYDLRTKNKERVDDRITYVVVNKGDIIYSKNFQIYKYSKDKGETLFLTKQEANSGRIFIHWFSCYDNIIVCNAESNTAQYNNEKYISIIDIN